MDQFGRALGCLLGMFVGDAMGAQTEFKKEKSVKQSFPDGIGEMDTTSRAVGRAGWVTDDSEMAIMLALSLIEEKGFSKQSVLAHYRRWKDAFPPDIGNTIRNALDGIPNQESQANGALMRIAPIGIVGSNLDETAILELSDQESALTHPNIICRDCNRIYALALAKVIKTGCTTQELMDSLLDIAPTLTNEPQVLEALSHARFESPGVCDGWDQGWVLLAFRLALNTLFTCSNYEQGLKAIILRAGDADTNAAIWGALAGAMYGPDAIPKRWIEALSPSACLRTLLPDQELSLSDISEKLARELLEIGKPSQ